MHLNPSDPDIATLYRKITSKRLDLQPSFQRGEVWGKAKKQRLIDSILRGWHIPPIHVIQVSGSELQEVLDGQQRLAAIRDFINGEFPINGFQEPSEYQIELLDGMYWNDLPREYRSKIEDFTIRILTISDYKPGEPGELFYRLNQPTNLTAAEQRNAYFGEARQEVKELAHYMDELGYSSDLIGFSNSRMAYDDVIAKYLLTLELQTLSQKITANSVTARYRASEGFASELLELAKTDIFYLHRMIANRDERTKLNKATMFSWLVYLHRARCAYNQPYEVVFDFFDTFEAFKDGNYTKILKLDNSFLHFVSSGIITVYVDRSSSRVADTSSIILRDIALWGFYVAMLNTDSLIHSQLLTLRNNLLSCSENNQILSEDALSSIASVMSWGKSL